MNVMSVIAIVKMIKEISTNREPWKPLTFYGTNEIQKPEQQRKTKDYRCLITKVVH